MILKSYMAGLKCVILLLQLPESWDYRCAPLYLTNIRNLNAHRLAPIPSVLSLRLIAHPADVRLKRPLYLERTQRNEKGLLVLCKCKAAQQQPPSLMLVLFIGIQA